MKPSYFKNFIRYATLNVLGMVGISCYILADTFFVANGVGADGLAALNLSIPVYSFIHGSALMLGIGGATKYTIAQSQGEHRRADLIFSNCLVTALLLSLLFVGLGLGCSTQIARLLKADSQLLPMTSSYLTIILLFAPFFMTNELLLAFVRNDGNPGIAICAMISGSVANIILDYVFIYPLQMGIFGAALATGIAPIVSMLILSLHKLRGSNQFHLRPCRLHRETIWGSILLGFPSLVTECSAGLVMIVFNTVILNLAGNIGVAAYGVIANIALVTTAIYTGLAQGIQPLVSSAYGQRDRTAISQYFRYAMWSLAISSVLLYGAMGYWTEEIAAAFNSERNQQLQTIAEQGLLLYFTSVPFTGYNVVLSSFFTSVEQPLPAHCISLLRGLILVLPMALIFSALWGLTGVWLTVPAAELASALVSYLFWKKRRTTLTPYA